MDSSYCLSRITIYAILLFVLIFCRSSSRVSLGLCLWRSHLLKLTKTPNLLLFAIFFYSFISACFSAHIVVLDRSKSYIFNHICWLENFCVYTEISFHFFGCFAAYISKVLLVDITGQRHIFGVFAA